LRTPGTQVIYQFFFRKYRFQVSGKITGSQTIARGLVRTNATLDFSYELVELFDDFNRQSKTQPHTS
jgi:hypothetical protein